MRRQSLAPTASLPSASYDPPLPPHLRSPGLTGIDIFDASGNLVQVDPEHISANPADINTLGGYSRDPRTVDKLVDRVNRTTDDLHM